MVGRACAPHKRACAPHKRACAQYGRRSRKSGQTARAKLQQKKRLGRLSAKKGAPPRAGCPMEPPPETSHRLTPHHRREGGEPGTPALPGGQARTCEDPRKVAGRATGGNAGRAAAGGPAPTGGGKPAPPNYRGPLTACALGPHTFFVVAPLSAADYTTLSTARQRRPADWGAAGWGVRVVRGTARRAPGKGRNRSLQQSRGRGRATRTRRVRGARAARLAARFGGGHSRPRRCGGSHPASISE